MKIFVLHPKDKISEVQRKFMTTVNSSNVFNIALASNFDEWMDAMEMMSIPMFNAGYGDKFRHRTGHCIGMDVHEYPFISEEDDTPLEVGMTFTIEPSIFWPGRVGDSPRWIRFPQGTDLQLSTWSG